MGDSFCENTSAVWRFIGYAIYVAKIIVPLIIIIFGVIELSKCVASGKDDDIKSAFTKLVKKLIIGLIIFFVPTITKLVFGVITEAAQALEDANKCILCLTSPFGDECKNAIEAGEQHRRERNQQLYDKDYNFSGDKSRVVDYSGELSGGNPSDPGTTTTPGTPSDDKDTSCTEEYKNSVVTSEPNPLRVIACYSDKYDIKNFVDKGNLGAWPSNYASIPTNIGSCGSQLLFPVNGNYGIQSSEGGYNHEGIDVGWILGTPVYAPAAGTAEFAWGEASFNNHGGESNYSVSIFLSSPKTITVDGKKFTITAFWIGHMLGVVSRTSKTVNQGDLIGYRGTAHVSDGVVSEGSHIHWGFQGKFEGESNVVFINDAQTIYAFSTLTSLIGSNVTAGTCF